MSDPCAEADIGYRQRGGKMNQKERRSNIFGGQNIKFLDNKA